MASLSVFDVVVYLQDSLAHHLARVIIFTPGKIHEAADTKEKNPLNKTIPITIFLYISAYIKIKLKYHSKRLRFFNRKITIKRKGWSRPSPTKKIFSIYEKIQRYRIF